MPQDKIVIVYFCESTPGGIPIFGVEVSNGHANVLAIGQDRVSEVTNVWTLEEDM